MTIAQTRTALQLRSLVRNSGELEVSLASVPIPEPARGSAGARRGVTDQSVRPRAAVRRRGHDDRQVLRHRRAARWSRPRVPDELMKAMAGRLESRCRSATRAPALWSKAGSSAAAQALLGKTVALLGGAMYSQYRCIKADAVPGAARRARRRPKARRASSIPLTALGMVETMRREGHTALVHTAAASNLGQMLKGSVIAGRHRPGQHRAQAGAGGRCCAASARRSRATPARPHSWTT